VTKDQIATYRAALKEARESFNIATHNLQMAEREATTLKGVISQLRRTITALAVLCSEEPLIDKLGITDAVIEAMDQTYSSATTSDVVDTLENMGFDLASQKNAAASVHAVLTRLAEKGAIKKITEKDTVKWRGPNYDPKYDDIPF
jgi:chromosome segregation ATPase